MACPVFHGSNERSRTIINRRICIQKKEHCPRILPLPAGRTRCRARSQRDILPRRTNPVHGRSRPPSGGLLPLGAATCVREAGGPFPGIALAAVQLDCGPGRHSRERIRGLLHKTKAAARSGLEKWLRDIGPTRLGASFTRHGADICPSNREHYHTQRLRASISDIRRHVTMRHSSRTPKKYATTDPSSS